MNFKKISIKMKNCWTWYEAQITSISMSSKLRFKEWLRFFDRNCIVKWVISFGSFCWAWEFLLKNMKLKKKKKLAMFLERVHEFRKLVCPKKVFQKYNFKYEVLNHLYFGPMSIFWVTALGCFSQCFFFQIFIVDQPWLPTF